MMKSHCLSLAQRSSSLKLSVNVSLFTVADPPITALPDDKIFTQKIFLKSAIMLPACDVGVVDAFVSILFKMASNMIHTLLPAFRTTEFNVTVAERADGLLRGAAEFQVATCLMLADVVVVDWVLLQVTSASTMRSVHATKVLREQVLTVEIVVVKH